MITGWYSLDITYRPGPNILVPDALSRAYLSNESSDEDLQSGMEVLVHSLVKNLLLSAELKSQRIVVFNICINCQKWPGHQTGEESLNGTLLECQRSSV